MVHERDSDRSMVLQLELELDLDLGGTWMPQEPEQLLVRRNEELNKHSNHNPFSWFFIHAVMPDCLECGFGDPRVYRIHLPGTNADPGLVWAAV
jgi:hypothetical protein